jgi:hypothetical protein
MVRLVFRVAASKNELEMLNAFILQSILCSSHQPKHAVGESEVNSEPAL